MSFTSTEVEVARENRTHGNELMAGETAKATPRIFPGVNRREAPQFYPDIKGAETKHPEPAH